MWNKIFPKRFELLKVYILIFMSLAFILRFCLTFWYFAQIDTSILILIKTFLIGFCFDLGTISFFALPYVVYLLIVPQKLYGTIFDRVIIYTGYGIGVLIFLFSFFAEITFWEEFERRFNFIAVDYLIYTYEVVKNINESYPIPILIRIYYYCF